LGCTSAATPAITIADATVGESGGYVDVPVTLSRRSTNVVTVRYRPINGSAHSSNEYSCPTPSCNTDTLTFAPGERTKTVRIYLLNDTTPEPTKAFTINLSSPANATLSDGSATIQITDDD
jgi:large repetitive protein